MEASLPTALLDACVLYPPLLRDLFLWLAVEKTYQPKWTEEIHAEWIENLLERRPELSRVALLRTRDLMNQYGGDCLVKGYEGIIESLQLPDADDRHVLAAAIVGKASTIVTFNLRDFPAVRLSRYGIVAIAPDAFICSLHQTRPQSAIAAVRRMHEALKNPPKTREEYVEGLRINRLNRFAEIVESEWDNYDEKQD